MMRTGPRLNNLGLALRGAMTVAGSRPISTRRSRLLRTPSRLPRPTLPTDPIASTASGAPCSSGMTGPMRRPTSRPRSRRSPKLSRPPRRSDPGRPGRLTNPRNGMHDRYTRTGAPADLEAAIAARRGGTEDRLIRCRGSGTIALTNLGIGLLDRHFPNRVAGESTRRSRRTRRLSRSARTIRSAGPSARTIGTNQVLATAAPDRSPTSRP